MPIEGAKGSDVESTVKVTLIPLSGGVYKILSLADATTPTIFILSIVIFKNEAILLIKLVCLSWSYMNSSTVIFNLVDTCTEFTYLTLTMHDKLPFITKCIVLFS